MKPKRSALKPKKTDTIRFRCEKDTTETIRFRGGAEYRIEMMQVRAYYPKRFAGDDTDEWTKIC